MTFIDLNITKLFSLRALALLLSLTQTWALTNFLGIETFGKLTLGFSVLSILVVFFSFGVDQYLTRSAAQSSIKTIDHRFEYAAVWHWFSKLILPVSFIFAVLTGIFFLTTNIMEPYSVPLFVMALLLPFVLIRRFIEALLLGLKESTKSIIASQVAQPAFILFFVFVLWIFNVQASVVSGSIIYLFGVFFTFLTSIYLFIKSHLNLKIIDLRSTKKTLNSEVMSTSRYFLFISLALILHQNLDVIMTGILSNPEDVALVRIATRVAELVGLIRVIALLHYKPYFAEAHAQGDYEKLQSYVSTLAIVFAISGLVFTLGLWLFAEWVLSCFGEDFKGGAWALRIYLIGYFFTMMCGPCNVVLVMTGYEINASLIVLGSVITNGLLNFILIPLYGAEGCAVANALSLFVLGFFSVIVCKEKLKINTTVFHSIKSINLKHRTLG